ncbi:MAG: SGNH/GDSL hydrolase family protein [Erythrobacter sp.]
MATGTMVLRHATTIWLALAAVLLGLVAWLWLELPHWRAGGTASTSVSSVTYLPHPLACPAKGSRIAIIGDSHVAGSQSGAGAAAFGAVLESRLGRKITVSRYGIGGATAADGESRWRGRDLPETDVVILALGTNDAAPRGWLRDKTPAKLTDFSGSLNRQIALWRARGHAVMLLAPPPGGSAAITARLEPYRQATRDLGRQLGIAVLDPADAFAACRPAQPMLSRDALHMNARGHQCLGTWLAHQFCPPNS